MRALLVVALFGLCFAAESLDVRWMDGLSAPIVTEMMMPRVVTFEEQQNSLLSTTDALLWLVIHREWVRSYAFDTDYRRHSTAFFDTREAALAWVNERFHKEPDRFVALRKCELPEAVESATETKRTEIVQEEKITKWK